MLSIYFRSADGFSASRWSSSGLKTYLWSPQPTRAEMERAVSVLGRDSEWVVWVGRPMRDSLAEFVSFSWPQESQRFLRFLRENPLLEYFRDANLTSGRKLFYPKEWLAGQSAFAAHQQIVRDLSSVVGPLPAPAHLESAYGPLPEEQALRAWAQRLNVKCSAEEGAGGRKLLWLAEGKYWAEPGLAPRPLSREEAAVLWEPRDLWPLFVSRKIDCAEFLGLRLFSPFFNQPVGQSIDQ